MDYKILDRKEEKNKVTVKIEINNARFRKAINKAYKNISQKANIPGFRAGKIPYQVIDTNYGKQHVLNEAASIVLSELYPQIIQNAKITPIDYPKVQFTQIVENKPLVVELVIPEEPEIEVPKYKGREVTAVSTEVEDKEVDSYIDNIRDKYSSLEPIEDEKKTADKGDYVTIDFTGTVDGKELEDGKAEDFVLEIGSKTLTPKFEEELIGMKKGEEKKAKFKLPPNIKRKDLSGKEAEFEVKLKEIKKKVVPEVDENFLKDVGDYEDEKEFREDIKEKLVEQKKQLRRNKIVEQIIDDLLEEANITAPRAMVDNRVKQLNDEFERNLNAQKVNKKSYLKALNISEEDLNKQLRERAEREVQEYLLLKSLEEKEKDNIEPKEEDIEKEKEELIKQYNKDEEKKKVQDFLNTPQGKENLTSSVRRRNLINLLVKNAKVVEEKKEGKKSGKELHVPEGSKTGKGSEKKLWTPK
ncbi:MAG: trigger factor [Actinomycetota bacterium]